MNLTPRLRQILQVMLEEGEVLPVKELASRIGVSKRTVQRELEHITGSLHPYHLTFETKTGSGVWLSGSKEDKKGFWRNCGEWTVMMWAIGKSAGNV